MNTIEVTLDRLPEYCQEIKFQLGDRSLILLSGALGAGKTKFVEVLLSSLAIKGVSSPTFTFHQVYKAKNNMTVDHFDLYRIQDIEDLESIGFWDVFARERGLIIVEWPEILSNVNWPLSWDVFHIYIEKIEEQNKLSKRRYSFKALRD